MLKVGALLRDAGQQSAKLPALVAAARRAAASLHFGAHGLRRPGPGETFWQHREHQNDEGLSQVDWRRSARGDRLYVRDKEREAPTQLVLWSDGRAGMAWQSQARLPTKSDYALIGIMALGLALRASGERISVLGHALSDRDDRVAGALIAQSTYDPRLDGVRTNQGIILASDGLEPINVWETRFRSLRNHGMPRALLLVWDPAEEAFPFEGRTAFRTEASRSDVFMIGRAQAVRGEYQALWRNHIEAITALARAHRFAVATACTAAPLDSALLTLAHAISEGRV
jgi:uncharacterized protein (DUF58 family)